MALAKRLLPVAFLLLSLPVAEAAMLHPMIRPFLEDDPASRGLPGPLRPALEESNPAAAEWIAVWVRTRDQSASLEASGLLRSGRRADVRPARWTRAELSAALLDPNVQSVLPAVRCVPSLDVSVPEVGLDIVHEPDGSPPAYIGLTGVGVVIGIVDSGVDLTHDDFLDGSGNTRLVSLWDQTVASSDPPRNFAYGKEWMADQIDAGMATETDTDGHGTHVAGIAAGNGSATGNGEPAYTFIGAAPESPIVFVKTDYLTTSVADGVDYIFQKADSLGLPVVVNLSLGTHYGPHDGTGDFAQSLNALVGPGHLVVAAAGNENGDKIHAERTMTSPDSATISFVVPSYTRHPLANNDEIDLDGWYTGGSDLSITLITPNGSIIGPVTKGSSSGTSTPDGRVEVDNAAWSTSNGDHEVYIRIYDQNASDPPAEGTWQIRIDAISTGPLAGTSEFDVWNFYSTMVGVDFLLGLDEAETVGSPATADSVIAVAAYVTKASWTAENHVTYGYDPPPTVGEIASFSSIGPRRDGALKPEIAAPGMGIGSARSADASWAANLILEDGVHVISQGTSMAAPHVTGLVALMFQQLGPLSMHAITDRLTSTARTDAYTGGVPNTTWGYGKIDALDATGYIVPVLLLEASATQEGGRVHVRFLLTGEAGENPLPIWRQGPLDSAPEWIGWTSSGRERTYTDSALETDGAHFYRLRIEERGSARWVGPVRVDYRRPRELILSIQPNPFLGTTRIDWQSGSAQTAVQIYDITGRLVRTLPVEAGSLEGSLDWNGTDRHGKHVPAGVYFVRLRSADGGSTVRKVLRIE